MRTGNGYKITVDACAKVGLELFDIGTDFLNAFSLCGFPNNVVHQVAIVSTVHLGVSTAANIVGVARVLRGWQQRAVLTALIRRDTGISTIVGFGLVACFNVSSLKILLSYYVDQLKAADDDSAALDFFSDERDLQVLLDAGEDRGHSIKRILMTEVTDALHQLHSEAHAYRLLEDVPQVFLQVGTYFVQIAIQAPVGGWQAVSLTATVLNLALNVSSDSVKKAVAQRDPRWKGFDPAEHAADMGAIAVENFFDFTPGVVSDVAGCVAAAAGVFVALKADVQGVQYGAAAVTAALFWAHAILSLSWLKSHGKALANLLAFDVASVLGRGGMVLIFSFLSPLGARLYGAPPGTNLAKQMDAGLSVVPIPGQVLRVVAVMAYAYLLWLDYCPIPDWQLALALLVTGFVVVLHGLVALAAPLLYRLDEEEEPISTPEQLLRRQTMAPGERGQRGLLGFLAMLALLFLSVLAAINEGVKRPAPAHPYIVVEGLPSYLAAYSGQYEHRGYWQGQPQYVQRGSAGNLPAVILQHRLDLEDGWDRWVLNGAEAGTPHPCPAGKIGKDGAGVDTFASDSVTPAGRCLAFAPVANLRAGVEEASLQWWVRSTTTTTATSRTSTATTRSTTTRTRITTPTPSFSLQRTSADAEGWVWALALTGHFLAAGGDDRKVRVYSLPDFRLHRALRDAEDNVWPLALTRGFLAAGGWDGKVRVYSV